MRTGVERKHIERLDWDSQFFGVPAGKVVTPEIAEHGKAAAYVQTALQEAKERGIRWLTARAHPWHTHWVHALESNHFRLVDTLMTLGIEFKNTELFWQQTPTPRILPANRQSDSELETLMNLARTAFADQSVWLDRFHADTHIPKTKADELYAQWVKNSIRPSSPEQTMADETFVCHIDKKPVGFITCQIKESGQLGVVSLNAVDSAYRKRGIYRELVVHSLKWFFFEKKCARVSVRTNLNSFAVQKAWAYYKADPIETEHTFHWWGQ